MLEKNILIFLTTNELDRETHRFHEIKMYNLQKCLSHAKMLNISIHLRMYSLMSYKK
jgi:hypothetical protein